jgi:hypothetical protein
MLRQEPNFINQEVDAMLERVQNGWLLGDLLKSGTPRDQSGAACAF